MKFILSAGGTGGHIYPALAVLEEIKKDSNNQYLYIGTKNRMESELIPDMGIPYEGIEIYGLEKGSISKMFRNILCIFKSYRKCLKIMDKFKPDAVIAFGGYVTYPVCKAARRRHVPIYLHEQNMLPGKTNRLISRMASMIFTSFEDSNKKIKGKNVIYTGNPTAQRAIETKPFNKTKLGFNKNKKLIIIVMGSLGSTSVNEKLLDFLRTYERKDSEIIFITGKKSYSILNTNLVVPKSTQIVPFFDNLPSLMKSADLIISRAGASTIAEIIATKTPSILIPSPYVANNHQYYNAMDLVNKNISVMIEEKDLNKDSLIKTINSIFDTNKYDSMKDNLSKIKDVYSGSLIVEKIYEDLGKRNGKKGKKKKI